MTPILYVTYFLVGLGIGIAITGILAVLIIYRKESDDYKKRK